MISNALQISPTPQNGKKSKAKKSSKSPLSLAPNSKSSKKRIHSNNGAENLLFSSMLVEKSKTTQTPTKAEKKINTIQTKNHPSLSLKTTTTQKPKDKNTLSLSTPKPKTPANKATTQQYLHLQNKNIQQEAIPNKTILKEALNLKKESKTLQDIQKITQENNLNLTKLEYTHTPKSKTIALNSKSEKKLEEKIKQVKLPKSHKKIDSHKHIAQTINTKPQAILANNQDEKIPQSNQPMPLSKDSTLSELLKISSKTSMEQTPNIQDAQEKKEESKSQDFLIGDLKKETQFKISQSRETLTHFSNKLREEIINYKPPFTKLTMELNPQELGKLEITISKKGKDLQVSVNANNPQALQTFIQNQNEFRNTLSTVGFSNVELNFSQGEKQGQQSFQGEENKKGNKNRLVENNNDLVVASTMEIKMVQYA